MSWEKNSSTKLLFNINYRYINDNTAFQFEGNAKRKINGSCQTSLNYAKNILVLLF